MMLELIALRKEAFDLVKREFRYIGILFLLSMIIFKIAFFRENFFVLLRSVLSLFWLFVLPGYFIMLYWRENLEFIERFIAGIVLSAAVIGIFSYYIGLLGLNIRYHAPLILIFIGIIINMLKKE
ncbi:hypothetical protein HYU09_05565 [Candidatus Woesearchaeota archaeon]|nr:hypothetical protein [Candidatus Woesearchaeota archaeon]